MVCRLHQLSRGRAGSRFRHGYAGTIYKGQGKTLDHTYLYHTHHWRQAASYVALTRQQQSAQVFVARETARDAAQLARQLARGEVKAASVAWATRDELAVEPARALQVREQQAPPGATRHQEPARDSLNVKVRAILEARRQGAAAPTQPDETSKEALRRELEALDRNALRGAARADRVGSAWIEQPMTVQDAARLVDPAYAASADRTALLREETAQVEKSIRQSEGVLRRDQEQGDRRWQEMDFLRQVMHKTGIRPDHALGINEGVERMAVEALDKLEPRRSALARQLLEAEKEQAAAFERAQPAAAAELARRQERGNLAREIIAERRQEQDQARERERSRDRDQGMDR